MLGLKLNHVKRPLLSDLFSILSGGATTDHIKANTWKIGTGLFPDNVWPFPTPSTVDKWRYNKTRNGPLARYIKLWVAHAPGMPRTFSPPPRVSDPDMHHGTCVTDVPWCMPGSLTSGFLWSRWRGKRSRHSWHMRNPQFYVSGKRPMACFATITMVESQSE